MKKYKRLTTKCEVGIGLTETSGNIVNDYEKVVNRLAELEDKIENGTLIDTKVKVGQRVYMRSIFRGEFDEYIVSNIRLDNGKLKISLKHDFDEGKTCYSTTIIGLDEIGEKVFLTTAKAEAKLKELRDGR